MVTVLHSEQVGHPARPVHPLHNEHIEGEHDNEGQNDGEHASQPERVDAVQFRHLCRNHLVLTRIALLFHNQLNIHTHSQFEFADYVTKLSHNVLARLAQKIGNYAHPDIVA